MHASTAVVMAALGAGVLIDVPGLRYEVPFAWERGPIERDLRWYGLQRSEPRGYDWQSNGGFTLPPEWLEQMELWDAQSRSEPLIPRTETQIDLSHLSRLLSETMDPSKPVHSDFEKSEILTLADLNAYMDAFLTHAPHADLNRDGAVDAEDLRIYLSTFDANFRP